MLILKGIMWTAIIFIIVGTALAIYCRICKPSPKIQDILFSIIIWGLKIWIGGLCISCFSIGLVYFIFKEIISIL